KGFNDCSIEDICADTGLSFKQAELAAQKEYSEPFTWLGTESEFEHFKILAEKENLRVLKGGRVYHIPGATDKATPLKWIQTQFSSVFPQIGNSFSALNELICLGDNHNDIAMLNLADYPVCVKSDSAPYPNLTTEQDVIYTQEVGPAGWNTAILTLLKNRPNLT
ncbi:MAG: HAD hydrolase family protein, partial [Acidiferrobacterales bacterium]|nr:HAD hydrolase family protein [Acidiferrobacterales bacterium]